LNFFTDASKDYKQGEATYHVKEEEGVDEKVKTIEADFFKRPSWYFHCY
jgi:hypothetical protein